jgi:hypothetical protein
VLALVDPAPRFHQSFLAAIDEFVAAGEDHYAKLVIWPAEGGVPAVRFTRDGLESPAGFARYTAFLLGQPAPTRSGSGCRQGAASAG